MIVRPTAIKKRKKDFLSQSHLATIHLQRSLGTLRVQGAVTNGEGQ